jgi:carbon storage regulator
MLALSRKPKETIVIGDDIYVTVVEVRGDRVKLSITAPKDIPIFREEVYEKIQEAARKGKANVR